MRFLCGITSWIASSGRRRPRTLRRVRRSFVSRSSGGGHTGVEYAGALAELIYGPLLEDYPEISRDEVEVSLIEGEERLLRAWHPAFRSTPTLAW